MMYWWCLNLGKIAILNINGIDYCCISGISKSEAVNLMQNIDSSEKVEHETFMKNLLSYIKMVKGIIAFGDVEVEKHKFHHYKSPIFLEDVGIENV